MKRRNKKIVAFIVACLAVLYAASMYGYLSRDEQEALERAKRACQNAPLNQKVFLCKKYQDLQDKYYGRINNNDDNDDN